MAYIVMALVHSYGLYSYDTRVQLWHSCIVMAHTVMALVYSYGRTQHSHAAQTQSGTGDRRPPSCAGVRLLSYGINSYGVHSYGLHSYGLYSYGLCS